jgi:hypothetical protein
MGVQRPISSLFIGHPGILLAYPIAFYKQTEKNAEFGKGRGMMRVRGIKSYKFGRRAGRKATAAGAAAVIAEEGSVISISTLRPAWGAQQDTAKLFPLRKCSSWKYEKMNKHTT